MGRRRLAPVRRGERVVLHIAPQFRRPRKQRPVPLAPVAMKLLERPPGGGVPDGAAMTLITASVYGWPSKLP